MSSSLRRGTLAATTIALAVVPLSACGTGSNAQTLQVTPDSAAKSVDDVQIQGVNFVVPEKGEQAALTARIFNSSDKPQQLTNVKVGGSGLQVELSPAKGKKKLTVPAHGHLAIGGKDNASAMIPEAGGKLKPGEAQRLSFDLSRTGKVDMRAIVVSAEDDNYGRFGPSGPPTPSEAPTASTPESPGAGDETDPSGEPTGESSTAPGGDETDPAGAQSPTEGTTPVEGAQN